MLLKNLLKGVINPELLLIKDCEEASGLYIVKEIISQHLERKSCVHFFSFERPNRRLLEDFKEDYNFKFHDVFTSICLAENDDIVLTNEETNVDSVVAEVKRCIDSGSQDKKQQNVIVFDSVAEYLLMYDINKLTSLVSKLSCIKYKSGSLVFPMVMILHCYKEDGLNETTPLIERLASVVLTVSSFAASSTQILPLQGNSESQKPGEVRLNQPGKNMNPSSYSCLRIDALHKKRSSGKRIRMSYVCWLDSSDSKFCFDELKEEQPSSNLEASASGTKDIQDGGITLPHKLTTFKIELEEEEKKSRDKLILPYMKHLKNASGGLPSNVDPGMGRIHYEPDANDDWDDEDPDDDLDI